MTVIRPLRLCSVLLLAVALAAGALSATARDWVERPWMKTHEPFPGAGETINLRTAYGTTLRAYLAGPESADQAVVLIHDRWGLNGHVTAWADRLADDGYRVLAVDLYGGREVLRDSMADLVWRQTDPVWTEANLDAALRFVSDSQDRVAVAAWGRGIGPAIELGKRKPDEIAALVFYTDPEATALVGGMGWMPMPVLNFGVARSPVHLRSDRSTAETTDRALEATHAFLSDRADRARR